jgi:hypothetical protein
MIWVKLAISIALIVLGSGKVPLPFPIFEGGVQRQKPAPRREVVEGAKLGGLVSPDGTEEIHCDLPKELHLRNVGGTDGAGLCVFASAQHSSTWQHIDAIDGIFKYMQSQPGGGWPEKVDRVVATMAARNKLPIPGYIQVESKDPLAILKLACKTGRMPGVTYSYSPTGRYNGQYIAHMVSLVHASDKWFAILDNNFPGTIEWMDPATFAAVHTKKGRELGWSCTFLADAPPPVPTN